MQSSNITELSNITIILNVITKAGEIPPNTMVGLSRIVKFLLVSTLNKKAPFTYA